ncbi:hypothetical protein OKW24_001595 [Peribacillus simplex]|nr:hypothetical protein [Peribacillus simplex]
MVLLVSFGDLLVNSKHLLVSFGVLLVNFKHLLVSFGVLLVNWQLLFIKMIAKLNNARGKSFCINQF